MMRPIVTTQLARLFHYRSRDGAPQSHFAEREI
jgi:hypothetical protein